LSYEIAACVLERAQLALQSGNYEAALALTEEILEHAQVLPEIWEVRAQALSHLGRVQEAVEAARRYCSTRPEDSTAYWELATIAWRGGRLGLAQQAMEKALELTDRNPGLLAEYAWFMAFERGPRLAEAVAREAVSRAPESATAWAALGLALLRLHRIHEAEDALGRALRLDPNDPCAQCGMLFLLKEQRKNKSALALSMIMEDIPEAKPLASEVRREITRRLIAQKLVERGVELSPSRTGVNWTRPIFWTLGAMVGIWQVFIWRAEDFGSVALCLGIPLVVAWLLDRLFTE
jgi:Tfp pilus assembly protein PilF